MLEDIFKSTYTVRFAASLARFGFSDEQILTVLRLGQRATLEAVREGIAEEEDEMVQEG